MCRKIAGRDQEGAKYFYLAFVESGKIEEYKQLRDVDGLNHEAIMTRA